MTNFDEKAFANPVAYELALKVDVAENPEYTAFFPHKHPCDVNVRLKNGTILGPALNILKAIRKTRVTRWN